MKRRNALFSLDTEMARRALQLNKFSLFIVIFNGCMLIFSRCDFQAWVWFVEEELLGGVITLALLENRHASPWCSLLIISASSEALFFVLSRAVEEELNLFPSADHVQFACVHVCLVLLLAGRGTDETGNFLGRHGINSVGTMRRCTGAKCSHQRRHCLLKVVLLLDKTRSRVTWCKFRWHGQHITLISLVMMHVMLMLQMCPDCLLVCGRLLSGASTPCEKTRHFRFGRGRGGFCDFGVV